MYRDPAPRRYPLPIARPILSPRGATASAEGVELLDDRIVAHHVGLHAAGPARIGEARAALSLRAASANFSCNSASRALLASSCWVSSSFYRSCTSFCVLAARSAASSWPSRTATRACNYFWANAAIIFRSCSMNAGSMRDPLCPPRAPPSDDRQRPSATIGNGHRQRPSATIGSEDRQRPSATIGNGHRQRSATAMGNDRQRSSAIHPDHSQKAAAGCPTS